MKQLVYPLLLFFITVSSLAQTKLDKVLTRYNSESVPYIYVEELKEAQGIWLLDTRAKEEFQVSRLKDAIWVGYDFFDASKVTDTISDKNQQIVVYCSIGVRSEDIGEKLQELGFTNVRNLYGGIFEWKNQDGPVYDSSGTLTDKVHAFDKEWGTLLTKGKKVYHEKKKD